MTYKEAINAIQLDGLEITATAPRMLAFSEGLKKAEEVLEKAEKYKWHDLRKDPNDLPCDDRVDYFVCVEYENGLIVTSLGCLDIGDELMIFPALGNWIRNGYHIIAWREADSFL